LRPIRFAARSAEAEAEVVRRVFREENPGVFRGENAGAGGIAAYLDSFLPVPGETLEALAAFFAASVAYKAALLIRKKASSSPGGGELPAELTLLGKYASARAEAAGFERLGDSGALSAIIMERAGNFKITSLFFRFLECLLSTVSKSQSSSPSPSIIAYNELWKKYAAEAAAAVGVRQDPGLVLERLFTVLSRALGAVKP
jgi:hypothetical protein